MIRVKILTLTNLEKPAHRRRYEQTGMSHFEVKREETSFYVLKNKAIFSRRKLARNEKKKLKKTELPFPSISKPGSYFLIYL